MNEKALLIIAISARPYAQAASKAGFRVTVIDAFLDQETVKASTEAFTVPTGPLGFEGQAMLSIIKQLPLDQYIGCIVGSGFEMQPNLLSQITQYLPVLGNAPSVIEQLKNPNHFFNALSNLNITFPPLLCDKSSAAQDAKPSLIKRVGGSGGQHITWHDAAGNADQNNSADRLSYRQAFVDGLPISVLFLAGLPTPKTPQVTFIGCNEQWVNPTDELPFRLGGVVSNIPLTDQLEDILRTTVESLAAHYGLLGLNSLDVVVADSEVFVLEINPRLSLSLDLYLDDWIEQRAVNLLEGHINVCQASQAQKYKNLPAASNRQQAFSNASFDSSLALTSSKAIGVVYAEKTIAISANFKWPSWVVDRPNLSDEISATGIETFIFNKGEPICSVVAAASDSVTAKKLAQLRVMNILKMLH